ncbi:MAG: formyltransferase family protein [Pseudomonadota bacterium]
MDVVFLCGDRSDYGLCHVAAIAKSSLTLRAVVVPTQNRWETFDSALHRGRERIPLFRRANQLRRWLAGLAPRPLLRLFGKSGPSMSSLRQLARRYEFEIQTVDSVNDPVFIEGLTRFNATVLLTAAYPQLFSEDLLQALPLGCINFHPSLLPAYRGAYPHFWVLARGEEKTGVSAHFMTQGIDDGPLIAQREIILSGLDFRSLYARLQAETEILVKEVAEFLGDGGRSAQPQDESYATIFKQPGMSDVELRFDSMRSVDLFNLVRTGLAGFISSRGWVAVRRMSVERRPNKQALMEPKPGEVLEVSKHGLLVASLDGSLLLEELWLSGRKTSGNSLLRKLNLKPGDQLLPIA